MTAPSIDRATEIERLAALEAIDYEVVRVDEAKRLGIRSGILDQEVAKKRRALGLEGTDGDPGQGRAVKILDILPWPDPVDGDHVAEALRATIGRYAVLSDAAADAIALWILLSWAVDNFSIAPRLAVTSPTKGCGKTTVLRLLNKLTRRALKSGCITTAALFRAIEQLKPTLILDENEKYLEAGSDLHAILNEGHCRGATVLRLLADIKAIFDDNGADRLSSEQICEALVTMEGHPWAEFGKAGKPITKNKLAYRLDRFGIRSATKRIGDQTAKGYYRHQFDEAWSRYLTVDPPSEPSQRHNSDETGTSSVFQNVTQNVTQAVETTEAGVTFQDTDVTSQKCEKAAPNGHCDGVTFQKGPADACANCQRPETPAHPLLQVGIDGYCVRLHRGCMDGYAPVLNNGGNSR